MRSKQMITLPILALMVAEAPMAFSMQEILDWAVKFGFAVVVAVYLLVKTTNAIDRLSDETMRLRQAIEGTAKDIQREAKEIKDNLRDITRMGPHR